MANITVKYNGSTILDMNATGTKTFQTAGKYCASNIIIQYSKPSLVNREDEIINRTIFGTYINNEVTTIKYMAFRTCEKINTLSFPACTAIRSGFL